MEFNHVLSLTSLQAGMCCGDHLRKKCVHFVRICCSPGWAEATKQVVVDNKPLNGFNKLHNLLPYSENKICLSLSRNLSDAASSGTHCWSQHAKSEKRKEAVFSLLCFSSASCPSVMQIEEYLMVKNRKKPDVAERMNLQLSACMEHISVLLGGL